MKPNLTPIKHQILEALAHPEADEGLYLRNFCNLHETDERTAVEADETILLLALEELVSSGEVKTEKDGEDLIFILGRARS